MNYIDILGESLKSEFLFDLFETYDVDVIYEYDRTYENLEDEYRAEIPKMGLGFIFDASQRLTTLFMKKAEHSGYNPFEGDDPRKISFRSGSEAMRYAKEKSIDAIHHEAESDSFLGEIPEWVKFIFESYSIHYQFNDDGLNLVTLQLERA
jgi:hypothetical protein